LQGEDHGANFRYQLNKYSNGGQLLESRDTNLHAGPGCSRYGCVCDVKDVSEQQVAVLALCRAVSETFVGGEDWHNQWIAVFRADDLTSAGEAEVKTSYTRVALASAEGHTYAVAVDEKEVVRIYSVPDR
jgi:hypothetical protein